MCDATGHDEDCEPESVGDTDADADGYVDATCCNGETCANDCDDADARVHPGVGETCDGRDNDCDGAVDEEGGGSVCPGGTCTSGRCSLRAWTRTWGDASDELTAGVAMDGAGNVYVAGAFVLVTTPSLDFAWDRVIGGGGWDIATGVARAADGSLFVSGFFEGRQDLGGGLRGSDFALTGYILGLSSSGGYVWSRALEPRVTGGCGGLGCGYAEPQRLALDGSGNVVATGRVSGTLNFGSGDVTAPGWEVLVASYTAAGVHRNDGTYGTIGDVEQLLRIAIGPADSTAIAGTFDGIVDFGSGARSSAGGRSESFVARLAN